MVYYFNLIFFLGFLSQIFNFADLNTFSSYTCTYLVRIIYHTQKFWAILYLQIGIDRVGKEINPIMV